ncbi:MAG: tRNA (guanosine(37)-N1)-methyltransferase TrmD, partial [Gemmatimonadetes bacterium]|nr:tRNA (guanosine(37)-N1)-methyltransferase TrmD [Gemmatimonadota bacterium]
MRIHVVTLFPEMFDVPLKASIMGRAAAGGLVEFILHQLRDYTHDRHRTVDDEPYGGGPGMVMKPEPLFEAVESILRAEEAESRPRPRVVLMSAQGRLLTQAVAQQLAGEPGLILLCGRYEGVDERVAEHLA